MGILSVVGADLVAKFVPRTSLKNAITAGQTIHISVFQNSDSMFYNVGTKAFDQASEPPLLLVPQIGTTGEYSLTLDDAYTAGDTGYTVRVVAAGVVNQSYPSAEDISAGDAAAKTDSLPPTLKKSTAIPNFKFPMYDAAGDLLPGLATVTALRSLDNTGFTSMVGTVTERSDGLYEIDIAVADTNAITGAWKFTATGAVTTLYTFLTES